VALLALSGCGTSAPHLDGVWILRYEDKNLMVLILDKDGAHGTLARPAHMELSSEGAFSKISRDVAEHTGQVGAAGSDLSLKLDDGDELVLHVTKGGALEVRPAGGGVRLVCAMEICAGARRGATAGRDRVDEGRDG